MGENTNLISDFNAGDYIGTFGIPVNFDYTDVVAFNVTNFLKTVSAPYVAFNLRTLDNYVFNSYDNSPNQLPPQLHVTFVPEPTTATLLLLGMLGCGWRRCRGNS